MKVLAAALVLIGLTVSLFTPPAQAAYLSKTRARAAAWYRVRAQADGRFWVQPAAACFRYTTTRVACSYWQENFFATGKSFFCVGRMMVTLYVDGPETRGVDVHCGT
jgi:hypothetical protein